MYPRLFYLVAAILLLFSFVSIPLAAEETDTTGSSADTMAVHVGDDIIVVRSRADRSSDAVPFSNLHRSEITKLSYGQDLPMVLTALPSVYAYSDAGGGDGYSYLQIRGFNQNRIGMMLNGVPLNDPEAHQVYWVDHGDLLADASSVQVQRGIGATLFGATSFGGSVNVLTSPSASRQGFHLKSTYGNYTDSDINQPSRLHRASFASGPVLDGQAAFSARYSRMNNEGYRHASGSDQESFALSGLVSAGRTAHKVDLFSGRETTHFSWDGIIPMYGFDLNDREDRRYNYYSNYKNNIDDFAQTIASLTSDIDLNDRLNLSNTLYYIKGDGFYEQYKGGRDLWDYGFDPVVIDSVEYTETDLVQKRWLQNDHWGILPQISYTSQDGIEITGGLGFKHYESAHFGEIIWTDLDIGADPLERYYQYDTAKKSYEAYGSLLYPLTEQTSLTAALQYQGHRYQWRQNKLGNFAGYGFDADHDFLSPRLGLRHHLDQGISLYSSISYAEREPSDSDYIDGDDPSAEPAFENAATMITGLDKPLTKPEQVYDIEFGCEINRPRWQARLGLYQLDFNDELIPVDGGRVMNEGRIQRANADKTRHQGVELEGAYQPVRNLALSGNLSLARHRYVSHEIWAYWLNDWAGGLLSYDDNIIPRSPELLANLSATWDIRQLRFWAQAQHIGQQYIDGINTEASKIDRYTIVNLSAQVELADLFNFDRSLSIELRVNNLFDTLYETYGYVYYDGATPTPYSAYWPGATRSIFISLGMSL